MNGLVVPRDAEVELIAYLNAGLATQQVAARVQSTVSPVTDMAEATTPTVHAALVDTQPLDIARQQATYAIATYAPSRRAAWALAATVYGLLGDLNELPGWGGPRIDSPVYDPTGVDGVHRYRFSAQVSVANEQRNAP